MTPSNRMRGEPDPPMANLDAIHAALPSEADVFPRDFRSPRRLSPEQSSDLAARVDQVLPEVAKRLARWLRTPHEVVLSGIVESDLHSLAKNLVEPLRAIACGSNDDMGLLVWDAAAMVAAVETALGAAHTSATRARSLTPAEERILVRLVSHSIAPLADALQVGVESCVYLRDQRELARRADADRRDCGRVGIHISLRGPSAQSTLRFYVPPGCIRARAPAPALPRVAPPAHLDDVELELHAELGRADVPLQELLAFTVGDVVLLDSKLGDPIHLTADGERRASATLGRHDDRLAIQIQRVAPRRTRSTP